MSKSDRRLIFFSIGPTVLILVGVTVFPIVTVLLLSVQRRLPIFDVVAFAGLDNYHFLVMDPRFWRSLANTAYFTTVSVGLEVLLGLAMAMLLHRSFPGRGWMRAVILVPWAIPTVVSARMWDWLYNVEFGLFNFLGLRTGLLQSPVNWLGDPIWAIHAAILMDVWKTTPFVVILLLAGLQTIPKDLYQAAKVDGAGSWAAFIHITLPSIKPMILVVLLFRTLDAFRVFDAIYVLTGGGPANSTETLSIYTYKVLFQTLQFGYGSALAVAMFGCVVILSFIYLKALGRDYWGRLLS